jgi:hypothetical protein
MIAWLLLTRYSSAPSESTAWVHLNSQNQPTKNSGDGVLIPVDLLTVEFSNPYIEIVVVEESAVMGEIMDAIIQAEILTDAVDILIEDNKTINIQITEEVVDLSLSLSEIKTNINNTNLEAHIDDN